MSIESLVYPDQRLVLFLPKVAAMNAIPLFPRKLLIIGTIVLLSSVVVTAQQNRGTLRGVITDELGPLAQRQ